MTERGTVGGFGLHDEVMVQIGTDLPCPGIVTEVHLGPERVEDRPYLVVRLDIGDEYVTLWTKPDGSFMCGLREVRLERR